MSSLLRDKDFDTTAFFLCLDVLKKIAPSLHVSTDFLLFEAHERGPDEDLSLQFEAVSRMPEKETRIVKALLEGMIVKYQTKQMCRRFKQLGRE